MEGASWRGLVQKLGKAMHVDGSPAMSSNQLSEILRGILALAMQRAMGKAAGNALDSSHAIAANGALILASRLPAMHPMVQPGPGNGLSSQHVLGWACQLGAQYSASCLGTSYVFARQHSGASYILQAANARGRPKDRQLSRHVPSSMSTSRCCMYLDDDWSMAVGMHHTDLACQRWSMLF